MEVAWWPLSPTSLDGVLAGRLRNPSVVLGVLALMLSAARLRSDEHGRGPEGLSGPAEADRLGRTSPYT